MGHSFASKPYVGLTTPWKQMDHRIHSFIQKANIYRGTMLGTWGKTRNEADVMPFSPRAKSYRHMSRQNRTVWRGLQHRDVQVQRDTPVGHLSLRSVSGSPEETHSQLRSEKQVWQQRGGRWREQFSVQKKQQVQRPKGKRDGTLGEGVIVWQVKRRKRNSRKANGSDQKEPHKHIQNAAFILSGIGTW